MAKEADEETTASMGVEESQSYEVLFLIPRTKWALGEFETEGVMPVEAAEGVERQHPDISSRGSSEAEFTELRRRFQRVSTRRRFLKHSQKLKKALKCNPRQRRLMKSLLHK